jgi:hypothetical protein
VCGTITALPDNPAAGQWTLHAGDLGDISFEVNANTTVTPPDVLPAVDMRACANLSGDADARVAEQVQLHPVRDGGGRDHDRPRRLVELRGTVAAIPDDTSGEWTLSLALADQDAPVDILIDADTAIRGELAIGTHVIVQATVQASDAGDVLTAVRVLVVTADAGKGHLLRSTTLRGTVEAVDPDSGAWTIAVEDGTVQVMVTDRTRISGLASDADPVGLHVVVVAHMTAAGAEARLIRVLR